MRDEVESMVDRILTEGPIGAAAAGRLLGTYRGGRTATAAAVIRYVRSGVSVRGAIIKLEGIRVAGGRYVTSRAALIRFVAAMNQPDATVNSTVPQTLSSRRRAADDAERELDAMGVR